MTATACFDCFLLEGWLFHHTGKLGSIDGDPKEMWMTDRLGLAVEDTFNVSIPRALKYCWLAKSEMEDQSLFHLGKAFTTRSYLFHLRFFSVTWNLPLRVFDWVRISKAERAFLRFMKKEGLMKPNMTIADLMLPCIRVSKAMDMGVPGDYLSE